MKTILTFLGLMVFSFGVLNASSGLPQPGNDKKGKPGKVHIFLRYVTHQGVKKLSMTDSNGQSDYNDLTTEVHAGSTVTWKLDEASDIVSIDNVYTNETGSTVLSGKVFKGKKNRELSIQIPVSARGTVKYVIVFSIKGKKQITIDPYIRVVPPVE